MRLLSKESSVPLGGRKQIERRLETDCTKLKQTEKFSSNYACSISRNMISEGTGYFVVRARGAQA